MSSTEKRANLCTMVAPATLSKAMLPDPVKVHFRIGVRISGLAVAWLIRRSKVARMTVSTSDTSCFESSVR